MRGYMQVFLGGTIPGRDWRSEIIPLLDCDYFNPVVKDWDEKAKAKEDLAKEACELSIYTLTPSLEGLYSLVELMEDATTRRVGRTAVCILDKDKFSKEIQGSLDAVMDTVSKYAPVYFELEACAHFINNLAVEGDSDVYLYKNPWLSLKQLNGPTGPYIYSHEERCDGHIVAVLPHKGRSEFLARDEFTPPWSIKKNFMSSITGGVDKGESPEAAALRELKEETGYEVSPNDLIPLGTTFGTKSSDTVYHLYGVDVEGLTPGEIDTEGDANESRATNVWVDSVKIGAARDPILYALFYKVTQAKNDLGFFGDIKW